MRTVIQRVTSASVEINSMQKAKINKGILVLLGIEDNDTETELKWMCDKLLKLRIFNDEEGKMNRSVTDINGELLIISQFTLYGDGRKGSRPSYIRAARPEKAIPLYNQFIDYLKNSSNLVIESGVFGADMKVSLVNDGPVTLILEKETKT